MNWPLKQAKVFNTYKSIREIKNDNINFKKVKTAYLWYLKHDLRKIYSRPKSGYIEVFFYGEYYIQHKLTLLS